MEAQGVGLARCCGPGRKPKLDKRQRKLLDKALRQGVQAHGFGTAMWTLPRVATLIERLTGVRYHPGHVGKILGAMNGTLPRLAKQARERNEPARRKWGRSAGRQ